MKSIVSFCVFTLFCSHIQADQRNLDGESKKTNSDLLSGAKVVPPILKLNKASELIGTEVRSPENDRLGEIKDLMIGLRNGRIVYAVLGVGGFLGIGDKLIALPPNALAISSDQKHLTLHADKESLRAAPSFEKSNWPGMADTQWMAEAERHYAQQGGQPIEDASGAEQKTGKQTGLPSKTHDFAVKHPEAPPSLRASDLIGMTVENPEGEKVGDIKDAAVDLSSGKIRYLVVSTGGVVGIGEKLFAIPPQSFQKSEAKKTLVLDADKELFQTASPFDHNTWPVVADKAFAATFQDPAGSPRSPDSDGRTALDQGNSRRDLMITQQLRRAIMADDTMSVLTRNITIITADGRITVRGTVANQKEVDRIVAFAREIAGNEVTNELTIQNEKGDENETVKP